MFASIFPPVPCSVLGRARARQVLEATLQHMGSALAKEAKRRDLARSLQQRWCPQGLVLPCRERIRPRKEVEVASLRIFKFAERLKARS